MPETHESLLAEYREALSTKYTQSEIDELGEKGHAFGPDDDGHYSYPIDDEEDLKKAIKAVGRGKADHDKIRKYIIGRAETMGLKSLIPDNWNADGSLSEEPKSAPALRSLEWRRKRAGELRGTEHRNFRLSRVEIRDNDDGTIHLSGYASVTESPYDMGWYTETIKRGAFKKTLAENPDVQLLVNHGGLPLARTLSGTLQLEEDNTGLKVDADLDADDPDVRALVPKMRRGDIDQMSFAFVATRSSWNENYTERDITETNLHRGDVSVVNQGANPATSASVRADDALMALRHMGAVGMVEAFFERREGARLSDETLEYLAQAVTLLASDDAEVDEVRRLVSERATPKSADGKVMDALNAMLAWCTEAIASQSKDPDNNTDPDDAAVWKAIEALHGDLLAAIKLQAKDGSPDSPPGPTDPPGPTVDDDSQANTIPDRGAEVRARLEALRHPPRAREVIA